jgi:hypothetical protein
MPHQGLLVVSEQDPLLVGGELEESRVVRSRQSRILDPHEIEIGNLTLECAEDAAVEVLIGQQADHGR